MILIRCTKADIDALKKVEYDPDSLSQKDGEWIGVVVQKPWGHEREDYRDKHISVTRLYVHPFSETSMHCHPNKTVMIVFNGYVELHTLGKKFEANQGDMAVIEAGAFHQLKTSKWPVVVNEIESPPNKRDIVRLKDKYGRGQGYEATDLQAVKAISSL